MSTRKNRLAARIAACTALAAMSGATNTFAATFQDDVRADLAAIIQDGKSNPEVAESLARLQTANGRKNALDLAGFVTPLTAENATLAVTPGESTLNSKIKSPGFLRGLGKLAKYVGVTRAEQYGQFTPGHSRISFIVKDPHSSLRALQQAEASLAVDDGGAQILEALDFGELIAVALNTEHDQVLALAENLPVPPKGDAPAWLFHEIFHAANISPFLALNLKLKSYASDREFEQVLMGAPGEELEAYTAQINYSIRNGLHLGLDLEGLRSRLAGNGGNNRSAIDYILDQKGYAKSIEARNVRTQMLATRVTLLTLAKQTLEELVDHANSEGADAKEQESDRKEALEVTLNQIKLAEGELAEKMQDPGQNQDKIEEIKADLRQYDQSRRDAETPIRVAELETQKKKYEQQVLSVSDELQKTTELGTKLFGKDWPTSAAKEARDSPSK